MSSRSVRKQKEIAKAQEEEEQANTTEEEGVEEVSFEEIDKLQSVGINVADINKLKSGGCFTLAGLVMRTRKDLCNIKGLSETKVEKILEAVAKLHKTGFMTGTDLLQKRKEVIRISTGSEQLDKLLGGGIETMSITEVFGEFRSGKTQLSHTLCVTCQLPTNLGGGNGKVAVIDTEGTFRPERITAIAGRFGVSVEETLDNILVARAYTHEHQSDLITEIAAKMVEDQFRLLIVDSITALFRVDFSGRGELSDRQQKLGRMMSKLIKLAEEFNIAVFITNQVCSDPASGAMFVSDPKKPIGGHVLAHASTTRLSLRKGKGEQRVCKIYDSPCLPETEAVFEISEGGIRDSNE